MATKIARRRPVASTEDSGRELADLLHRMRVTVPGRDCAELRVDFLRYCTERRGQSEEKALEMWEAFRACPHYLPVMQPSRPASDE
jgi:hypothetical protein